MLDGLALFAAITNTILLTVLLHRQQAQAKPSPNPPVSPPTQPQADPGVALALAAASGQVDPMDDRNVKRQAIGTQPMGL